MQEYFSWEVWNIFHIFGETDNGDGNDWVLCEAFVVAVVVSDLCVTVSPMILEILTMPTNLKMASPFLRCYGNTCTRSSSSLMSFCWSVLLFFCGSRIRLDSWICSLQFMCSWHPLLRSKRASTYMWSPSFSNWFLILALPLTECSLLCPVNSLHSLRSLFN